MISICGETPTQPIVTKKTTIEQKKEPQETKQTTVTIPGNATMTVTSKTETKKENISKQIETLQNEPINPKTETNEYKTRNEKISKLQEEKEAKMTPEEIQEQIKTITNKIKELEKQKTKDNEYDINSTINFLSADKNHLEKLLQEKQTTQEEITF